jgi:hypothetical protein
MKRELIDWTLLNALGLALGFFTILQTGMLFEFGFNWQMHWAGIEAPVSQNTRPYFTALVASLAGGLIFGLSQAFFLRARKVTPFNWIVATVIGFGLLAVVIDWPLIAAGLLGVIPGPVEPIIATVGSGAFAGLFQFLLLRRERIRAPKWALLWVFGLVISLLPTALIFITLEELNISISWPTEVFVSGFTVGGVAALVSGRELLRTLAALPDSYDRVKS